MYDISYLTTHALIPIVITFLLVLINGFFVASEFALIGLQKSTVEKLAQEGNKTAIKIREILSDSKFQDKYIATSQLGITLASLGLGMYGEHMLAEWLIIALNKTSFINVSETLGHSIATVTAILILSYMHVVIGEMVPKSLALQFTQKSALIIVPIMLIIQIILKPLVFILHGLGNLFLRMIGIDRHQTKIEYHSHEELQYIVKESHEEGLMENNSAILIQELLAFGELKADEVMIPRVKVRGIPLGATYEDLVESVYMSTHTRYPIYNKDLDHIIGMVHIKDLLDKIVKKETINKSDIRETHFISGGMSLSKVFSLMRQTNSQMLVIIDDYGGTEGIITMEDMFKEVIGDLNSI
jgi:CBS domain containing-hemolysin-like protein